MTIKTAHSTMSRTNAGSLTIAANPTVARGATAGGLGALGLGVDVGLVTAPAESYDVAHPAPAKPGFHNRMPAEQPKARNSSLARLAVHICNRAKPRARVVSEHALFTDVEVELGIEIRSALADAEIALGPDHAARFNRIRRGTILVDADTRSVNQLTEPFHPEGLDRLANKIASDAASFTQADARDFARLNAHFVSSGRHAVQDYVQRVMREAYALQNILLLDYADKVERLNGRRKRIRELLKAARSTNSLWLAEGAVRDDFVADPPFDWIELDDRGAAFQPVMSEEDVAAWLAINAAVPNSDRAVGKAYDAFFSGPGLDADGIELLDESIRDKGHTLWGDGKTDNWIRDHIDEILVVLPQMNRAQFEKYLPCLINILCGGITDDEELIAIVDALSPVQALYLISEGFEPESYQYELDDNDGLILLPDETLCELYDGEYRASVGLDGSLLNAVGTVLSSLFESSDETTREMERVLRSAGRAGALQVDIELNDVTAEEAVRVLLAMRAAADPSTSAAGVPAAGSPKQIRTKQQMQTYLKMLEDELNGAGEDAQLANVDLQHNLQKQQQTLQMMTNISKMLHDTAMAQVRKVD